MIEYAGPLFWHLASSSGLDNLDPDSVVESRPSVSESEVLLDRAKPR